MNLEYTAIPPNLIKFIWVKCVPLIQEVIEISDGDLDMKIIFDDLVAGKLLLILITENDDIVALNVLEVYTLDSGKKVLYIPVTSGTRMNEWLPTFLNMAKQIAKDHGCVELRGLAVRKGWLRELKKHGWTEHFVTIKCDIGE